MTNYKSLLVALGITVSGSQVNAEENPLFDKEQILSTIKKPSFLFLDVNNTKDMENDDWNVGCSSTTNSGC